MDLLEELAPQIDDVAAEAAFSGVVTVDVEDERRLERTYGFAHRALQVPNQATTRFAMASGCKPFTSLAVLRLVQDGRLELSTPVRRVLGEDLPEIDDAVTVEHLLTHTSGIGDYLDEETLGDIADHVLRQPVHVLTSAQAFLPELDGHPQVAPPGQRFTYCNGGFMVLAVVAERASGLGFHELVEQEVLVPAGLERTAYLRSDELPGDAALGYLDATGDRTNVLHLPVRGNGDGGCYTTADDLHRFWRALLAGAVVPPEVVAEMRRPRHTLTDDRLQFGLGLALSESGDGLAAVGYDAGVSMLSAHDPATATTVTVLGNTSEGAWPLIKLLRPLVP